ncbi:hypothetical protein ACRQ1B_06190 [Rhizobium panacihumi]|uniref:hypothetical protein n=1 Tax=Rhizobium panacihumi TaxID=2008450 RepID=UPI003D798383
MNIIKQHIAALKGAQSAPAHRPKFRIDTNAIRSAIARAEAAGKIVYSAGCTWWDSIRMVGKVTSGDHSLPACPHCGSVLYEVENMAAWSKGIETYAVAQSDPTYPAFIEWVRGKCYPRHAVARAAFKAEVIQ